MLLCSAIMNHQRQEDEQQVAGGGGGMVDQQLRPLLWRNMCLSVRDDASELMHVSRAEWVAEQHASGQCGLGGCQIPVGSCCAPSACMRRNYWQLSASLSALPPDPPPSLNPAFPLQPHHSLADIALGARCPLQRPPRALFNPSSPFIPLSPPQLTSRPPLTCRYHSWCAKPPPPAPSSCPVPPLLLLHPFIPPFLSRHAQHTLTCRYRSWCAIPPPMPSGCQSARPGTPLGSAAQSIEVWTAGSHAAGWSLLEGHMSLPNGAEPPQHLRNTQVAYCDSWITNRNRKAHCKRVQQGRRKALPHRLCASTVAHINNSRRAHCKTSAAFPQPAASLLQSNPGLSSRLRSAPTCALRRLQQLSTLPVNLQPTSPPASLVSCNHLVPHPPLHPAPTSPPLSPPTCICP